MYALSEALLACHITFQDSTLGGTSVLTSEVC